MAFDFATDTDPTRLIVSTNNGQTVPITPFDSGVTISFWYLHDGNNVNTSANATLFSLNADNVTQDSCLNVYLPDADTLSLERWDGAGNGGFIDLPMSSLPVSRDDWHFIIIHIVDDENVNFYVDGVKAKLNHAPLNFYTDTVNMELGHRATGTRADYGMWAGRVCDFKIYRNLVADSGYDPDGLSIQELKHAVYPRFMLGYLAMWSPITFNLNAGNSITEDFSGGGTVWVQEGGADSTDPPASWSEADDDYYWPPTQTLTFTGIASAEAEGTPSLAHRVNFTGIPSASAQGTPSLDHRINFTGIASAAALGTPSLAQALSMFGIGSSAALGTPALDHRINFTGIASAEALGLPSLAQVLGISGIASAEALGLPSLAQVLAFTGIPSAAAFGVPALDHRLLFTGIPSAEALGTPSLAQVLSMFGIASAEALGTPALDHRISFVGIPSAEALGTPQLALLISFTGIASAEGLGTPALDHRIIFTGIPSAEAFGIPSFVISRIEALQLVAHIGNVLVAAGIGPGVAAESALRAVAELVRAGKITLSGRAGESPSGSALGGGLQFRVSFQQE